MASNAPGQLLGFSLQYPRALWHLLTCGPTDKVSLEVIGDVGVTTSEGKISEEDKSSQVGNPVTDKSSDLWKTFYNWVQQVEAGQLDTADTIFMLYTNKSGRKGIVDSFHAAKNRTTADKAISTALNKVKNIEPKHEIYNYVEYLKKHKDKLSAIVQKFEFVVGSATGIKEVERAIRSKHVADSQVEYLKHSLLGWLHEDVMKKLAVKQDALITWEEFDWYARKVFESARKRELIDFALVYPPDEEDHKKEKLERPVYIRQLEAIGCSDEAIQDAVVAFLRSKVNRQNWIEKELIDEADAIELHGKLIDYWDNRRQEVEIVNADLAEQKKGHLVYLSCKSRQQSIRNQEPPIYTISGAYHLMSNELSLGWHPQWKTNFHKTKTDK